jgi:nitroimidazol reductase NimA-like FMN-containing flavoprotein (pyridoxamine 5'-phosphate oxidase superfamily)
VTLPAPRSPALAAIEPLDDSECRAVVARQRLCVLSIVDGDEPYGVPLYYGFDGDTLYLGLAEGRKTEVLDRNGRLCLTVVEAGDGDAWASVQVTGEADWLDGEPRELAVKVLMEHNRRIRESGSVPSSRGAPADSTSQAPQPPRRHAGGRILRVRSPRFTGRTRR